MNIENMQPKREHISTLVLWIYYYKYKINPFNIYSLCCNKIFEIDASRVD